jgi:hypothetical protein
MPIKQSAFGPITLYRPMRVFGKAIAPSARVGEPFVPDADFLVRLITDYRGHRDMLRSEIDVDFKNFENMMRGRHQLSTTSLSSLSRRFGVAPDELTSWIHGNEHGALAPNLLGIFSLLETVPSAIASQVLAIPVLCKCCGANMLDDRNVFWRRQLVSYATPEYEFAERLLRATVGAACIFAAIAGVLGKPFHLEDVSSIAHPSKYPISHWLKLMQAHYGVSSLTDLSARMQLMPATECQVSYGLLKKWSSGSELMPVAVATALTKNTNEPIRLALYFTLARTICFIVDFLCSAALVKPTRVQAQEIVYGRINGLIANMRMAITEEQKRHV